jgi:hypothetical protein
MITGDEVGFPNNIVDLIRDRLALEDDYFSVVRRPLRPDDPDQSIGLYASMWNPDPESFEMHGIGAGGVPGSNEPSLGRYVVSIQAMVRDFDEERGLAKHSILSTIVRGILYRDGPLAIALSQLNVEVAGIRERSLRWGVTAQRFLNNEIGNNEWMFLSTVEFWLDTEIY